MTTVQAKHRKRRRWLTEARYRVIAISLSGSSVMFALGLVTGLELHR